MGQNEDRRTGKSDADEEPTGKIKPKVGRESGKNSGEEEERQRGQQDASPTQSVRNPAGQNGTEQNAGPKPDPVDRRRTERGESVFPANKIKVGDVRKTPTRVPLVAVDPLSTGRDGDDVGVVVER